MKTQFVLDALDQAICQRKTPDNKSLVHHSDRCSQYFSIKYTERLVGAEIDLSVGTVGDAYDNALAECVIGLFKTEVINQIGPWKSLREVDWETLKWVDWYTGATSANRIGSVVFRIMRSFSRCCRFGLLVHGKISRQMLIGCQKRLKARC